MFTFFPFFYPEIKTSRSESEKEEKESKIEIDDYSVVDDRERGTQTETIKLEKVFADELTVITFYDPC